MQGIEETRHETARAARERAEPFLGKTPPSNVLVTEEALTDRMANVAERIGRLAVMAALGCDEATAIARLDEATDRMLNATADAAQTKLPLEGGR